MECCHGKVCCFCPKCVSGPYYTRNKRSPSPHRRRCILSVIHLACLGNRELCCSTLLSAIIPGFLPKRLGTQREWSKTNQCVLKLRMQYFSFCFLRLPCVVCHFWWTIKLGKKSLFHFLEKSSTMHWTNSYHFWGVGHLSKGSTWYSGCRPSH